MTVEGYVESHLKKLFTKQLTEMPVLNPLLSPSLSSSCPREGLAFQDFTFPIQVARSGDFSTERVLRMDMNIPLAKREVSTHTVFL